MNWRIKGVVQNALSAIPGGMLVNDILQRTLGGLRNLDAAVDSKVVNDWLVLADHLRELNETVVGKVMLEVGTGWFPTLPFCFYLGGAKTCHTFDLHRHLSGRDTQRMLQRLSVHREAISTATNYARDLVDSAYAALDLSEAATALQRAGILYHAPADASSTELPANSVDIAYSNSVLEHVPTDVIQAIFHEMQRVLRPGGISMHSVNCGDHYAYFDRTLSPIHYLTYSAARWKVWNNDILYQNRLRPSDFLRMTEIAGLDVIMVKARPNPELLAQLSHLQIAPEFAAYSPEELCTTSIDFVARKPA